MVNAGSDARALLRGYLAATGVYVAGHLGLWAAVYRHDRRGDVHEEIAYAIAALLCLAFVVLTGRLALALRGKRVLRAAAVSAAAVLTAGLVRTALAAMGMRRFLVWDHPNVIAEAVMLEGVFAIFCFPAAILVAAASHQMFGRRQPRPA